MRKKFGPVSDKLIKIYHGGDYNPEQWIKYPKVLEEDIRLMKLAKCNVMTIGIFSWASIEPEEGVYNFEWLDNILDKLYENEIYFILSTPSGARPAWMSKKYPEVLRVMPNRIRNLHGERHNHCYTSPIYRKKVSDINSKLAERYSNHPGILAWHISNEYGGECHCELCQSEFRKWLKRKYKSLDNLNEAWWATFWSHTYTEWSQIESPAPHGEMCTHGLNLDWKRFVTDQTVEFYKNEIKPLKEKNPQLKVTTNFMELYNGLNYWKFKDVIDVVSWDNYPTWHSEKGDEYIAAKTAFVHDINRSILDGRPFMLMESTPSSTNWQDISKLKKPGMHILSSIQAVAHGADTVQYFQWRKSRGSSEKFHGSVVDHCGHENTRVFREVSKLGNMLNELDEIIGTTVEAEVAIIFDWENRWAINDSQGPRNIGIRYEDTVLDYYIPFWKSGVPVDVISMDCDFSKYKIVVAPMLYMVREGVAERLESFVKNGGVLVSTYLSGITDENDLCFLGGFPGPLRKIFGIWSEEIDALYDSEINHVVFKNENILKINGEFQIGDLCEIIECEGADTLATYKSDFYRGKPAITVNNFGVGRAYYIASRSKGNLNLELINALIKEKRIRRVLDVELPKGVIVQERCDNENRYIFLMNFNSQEKIINIKDIKYIDILGNVTVKEQIKLDVYEVKILKSKVSL